MRILISRVSERQLEKLPERHVVRYQTNEWKFCPDYAKCGEVKPVVASLTLFLEEARIEDADEQDWDEWDLWE